MYHFSSMHLFCFVVTKLNKCISFHKACLIFCLKWASVLCMALEKSQSVTQNGWIFSGAHGFDQDVVQRKLRNILESNVSYVRFKILIERN